MYKFPGLFSLLGTELYLYPFTFCIADSCDSKICIFWFSSNALSKTFWLRLETQLDVAMEESLFSGTQVLISPYKH